jgi:[ribosomal protein S18]-alanine N-acetyltransferase
MSALIDLQPSFRPMHAADLGLVANIERTLYPFPWSRGNFRDCLNAGYDCWITEINSAMTGYGVMLVGSGEAHLLNLSIRGEWQRRGLGRRLLYHFMGVARRRRAEVMLLEVRPSNAIARKLYQSVGFKIVATRRGYYPSEAGREDAIVMEGAL